MNDSSGNDRPHENPKQATSTPEHEHRQHDPELHVQVATGARQSDVEHTELSWYQRADESGKNAGHPETQ